MGEASRDAEMFEMGTSFARWLVTNYRTEERRKVSNAVANHNLCNFFFLLQMLGKHPYEEYKKLSLATITRRLMKCMKVNFSPSIADAYERNIALLVWLLS